MLSHPLFHKNSNIIHSTLTPILDSVRSNVVDAAFKGGSSLFATHDLLRPSPTSTCLPSSVYPYSLLTTTLWRDIRGLVAHFSTPRSLPSLPTAPLPFIVDGYPYHAIVSHAVLYGCAVPHYPPFIAGFPSQTYEFLATFCWVLSLLAGTLTRGLGLICIDVTSFHQCRT